LLLLKLSFSPNRNPLSSTDPSATMELSLTYIISMMYQHALHIHLVQARLVHNDDASLANSKHPHRH
jgi:hypothetical protein